MQAWERFLLVRLFFLLPSAWLALKIFGFNRARRMAERKLQAGLIELDPVAMKRVQRQAQLTSIASRHGIYKANCLHQSLALCWLLRRQGMAAQIRIGVRPNMQPFQAHAWVELDGIPLGQQVDEYKAFDRLTADPDTVRFI